MANTAIVYEGDGVTTDFAVPFDYLSKKFVRVDVNGSVLKGGDLGDTSADYYFLNATEVRLKVAPEVDAVVTVRRYTSATERIVTFKDASVLKAKDLDISSLQTMHIAEEARDAVLDTLSTNDDGNLDARFRRIVNLADPVDDKDALNYGTYKSDKQGAYQAKIDAESARDLAKEWATKMDGQVAGEDYSSKYYADRSKTSADASSRSEAEAKSAKNEATAQAVEAKAQAQTATTKASEASASATAAKDSETKAKTSETNAKASETNAKSSETKAKASEDNAKISETNAKVSETKSAEILASVTTEGQKQIEAIQAVTPTEIAKVSAEGTKQVQAVTTEGTTQVSAVKSAGSSEVSKVTDAGTTQVEAIGTAGSSEVSKVTAEGTKQVQAVKDQGTTSVNAVTTEGTTQVNLAKAEVTKATDQADRAYSEAERAKQYADQASQGQIQVDWNQEDSSQKDYIKNKPTLFTKTEADGLYLGKTAKAENAKVADSALSVAGANVTGAVANATSAVNATNATNSTNASNVPWTGVSGVPENVANALTYLAQTLTPEQKSQIVQNLVGTFLPLSGGTLTGTIVTQGQDPIIKGDPTKSINILSGDSSLNGAYLQLFGNNASELGGSFVLRVGGSGSSGVSLVGNPDGTLKWNNNVIDSKVGFINKADASYRSFDDGFIIQWGRVKLNGSEVTITLPIPMFTNTYRTFVVPRTNSGGWPIAWANTDLQTATKFQIDATGKALDSVRDIYVDWLVVGVWK